MYYVYELVDPRDDSVFYVGKGKGSRVRSHTRDAKRGVVGLKCDLIRAIWDAGYEVGERIVKRFADEDKAYAFEKRRIAKCGLESLTNIADGGREMTSAEFARRKAARSLARTMSRAFRVLSKHKEVGFWFGGKWHEVNRDMAERMANRGAAHVFDVLGETEGKSEFRKYNVFIENRA